MGANHLGWNGVGPAMSERRVALARRSFVSLLACLPLACAGAGPTGAQTTSQPTSTGDTTLVPPNIFTVPQIPVPPEAQIALEDTVIVGADESWTGQVVMTAPYRVVQVTLFFRQEMPKYGWVETAIVRSRRVAISFTRDDRVAIVRIAPKSGGGVFGSGDGSTEIDVIVSPAQARDAQARPAATGSAAPAARSTGASRPAPRSTP